MRTPTRSQPLSTLLTTLVIVGAVALNVHASLDVPEPPMMLTMSRPQVILVADDRYIPHYTPPPRQAELGIQTATFSVNWNPATCTGTVTAWPQAAKDAFQYALDIWRSLLDSSQTIVVDACWRSDLGSGILGSAGATTFHRNFTNAPFTNTWFPVALANAVAQADLNEDTAEIQANFNSTFNWYYGTDGNTPGDKYDFASVVLHEVGHGLGFLGFADVSYGTGYLGYSGYPAVYDRFTEDGNGTPLLNYTNPSTALGNALTGQVDGVYFDGPYANAANTDNGQNPVKLYTPSSWNVGSSYSHLDEIFNGTANSLMTYSLGYGQAEHNPGPVTLGMFRDMGWTLASVTPAPTVTSITPNSGENTGVVNITNLAGSDFQNGATVKLIKSGQSDINGTNVTVVSDSQITCDFDLSGAAIGQWDVVVANPDAQSGTLPNG
ncbi:MAG: hypothetical protein DRI61_14595, partial [Chloroflexi bacterium]